MPTPSAAGEANPSRARLLTPASPPQAKPPVAPTALFSRRRSGHFAASLLPQRWLYDAAAPGHDPAGLGLFRRRRGAGRTGHKSSVVWLK
jgi:hypothetical protein